VNCGIITKLGPCELVKPQFGLIVSEEVEVLLEGAIHDFRLSIGLGVVTGGHAELGAI